MRKMDEKDAKAALEQCAENNAKLWLLLRDAQNALLDTQIKNDEHQAALAAEQEKYRALVEAARALLDNITHNVGENRYDLVASWAEDALRDALEAKNEALREEVTVYELLLTERKRVMDAIPECPTHGECVPHAIDWVNRAKAVIEAAREVAVSWGWGDDEMETVCIATDDHESVKGAIANLDALTGLDAGKGEGES